MLIGDDKEMKFLKYLGKCIVDCVDILNSPSTSEPREILIGFFEILIVLAIFVIHSHLINWYYSLLITIAFVLSLVLIICFIDLILQLIKKYK